ncbi:MAG: VOC family protein [Cyanobacteriota bacterium]|nr:VOC family protein [Cyanobacteriota bacterium]
MTLHHVSIRTADIFRSIAFYEKLDFQVECRFTTGMTLACWLKGSLGRIELIQIPDPMPPPDAFGDPHYVGYYHLSWLVPSIATLLAKLDSPRILLPPCLQQIGEDYYRVAFMADPDGLPIEIMEKIEAGSTPPIDSIS